MSVTLATTPGGLDVWSLVMEAGPMAKFVLLVLAGFSIASWSIIAERLRRFRRAEAESRLFLERFHQGGGLAAIHDDIARLTWSPLADIYRAGFREISLNPPADGGPHHGEALGTVDRMLRKNATVQISELERSLGFLATTASATPSSRSSVKAARPLSIWPTTRCSAARSRSRSCASVRRGTAASSTRRAPWLGSPLPTSCRSTTST